MPESNQFLRHILTMVTGTALAQAIPLLVSPLLTRLYTPADFGVLSAVVAAAGILSVVSTLRYELAIVLPKDEAGAANLAAIALAAMVALCITTTILIAGFPDAAHHILSRASSYALVVPLLTALLSFSQLLSTAANREREYVTIATGSVLQQIVAALFSIGAGFAALPVNGLIVGRLSGYAIACVYYVRRLASILERWVGLVERPKLFEEATTYRQFPFFNVPYSLVGSISREFLILAFTAMHQAEAAGYYGLARSVLTAPIGFLSTSLSQVFYKEAAVSIGTPEFKRLTLNMLRYFGAGLLPFFVLGWFWAPDVFQLVFGTHWREAGNFAALLVPIGCLSLFTSWPERVFEVRRKQHWSLSIQLTFDSITVGLVTLALIQGATPLTAIKVYVAVQCIYHLTYLAAIFGLSGFNSKDFGKFVCFGAAVAGIIWLMDDLIAEGATTLWLQFGISVFAAIVSSVLLLLLAHRSAKSDTRKQT
jgi:O-antigen/teichoic acid export membrane protein